jgi:hypothetical protein
VDILGRKTVGYSCPPQLCDCLCDSRSSDPVYTGQVSCDAPPCPTTRVLHSGGECGRRRECCTDNRGLSLLGVMWQNRRVALTKDRM